MSKAIHYRNAELGAALGDVLSHEPERRKIEMELLCRLLQAAQVNSAAILEIADGRSSLVLDLAAMQSPIFQDVARVLERSIPEDAQFGRFRGRTNEAQ